MSSSLEAASLSLPVERPADIAEALRDLHIVRPVWLRRTYSFYPLILAGALLLDWLVWQGTGLIYNHLPRLFSYLAVLLAIFLFVRLYDQLPATLQELWDRGCLKSKTNEELSSQEYADYIQRFDHRLNGIGSWITGIALVLTFVPLLVYITEAHASNVLVIVLSAISFFLNGAGLWKLAIVAETITRLPHHFRIHVQHAHPDESGGLSPLGDLCFTNALILLGPALYFAAWVVFATSPALFASIPGLVQQTILYKDFLQEGWFHFTLLGILIMELAVFLLPLYQIHREMVSQGAMHRQELGALAQRIDYLNLQLISDLRTREPEEVRKSMDAIKCLRELYEHNERVPTWPFNRALVLRFFSSQIIPLLSLTGLAKPIIEAIAGLFK